MSIILKKMNQYRKHTLRSDDGERSNVMQFGFHNSGLFDDKKAL